MYAVVESGGKQYRVELGTEIEVDRLEAEPGQTISFERVLLVADGDEAAIGQPTVADATVTASVVRRDRGEKLIVFKYRPKARTRVKKGHRQDLTVLRVADIVFGGRSAAEQADAERVERERAQADAVSAAARQAAADQALARKLAREADSESGADVAPAKTGRSRAAAAPKDAAATPKTRPGAAAKPKGDAAQGRRVQAPTPDPAPKRSRTKKDE